MPQKALTRDEIDKAIRAVDDAIKRGWGFGDGKPSAISEAARVLGVDRRKIEHRIAVAKQRYNIALHIPTRAVKNVVTDRSRMAVKQEAATQPTLPDFPDDDIPVTSIIDLMCNRFEKRTAHREAKKWFKIEMPSDDPFAVMWWGDPHLDSNGCNWPLLKRHVELAKSPGVYSVNMGDTLDNWPHGSRLIRLYAHSDTSVETARKLAKWFMHAAGVQWLLWILGNHDTWEGHAPTSWLKEVAGKTISLNENGAQFVLSCPSHDFKVHAAHDFPGHSQFNPLHGGKRKAMSGEAADIYVCGHRHNWALHREEHPERGFTYSIIRARGYKYIDEHADALGLEGQAHGASILTVFDPKNGRHYNFEHPEDGVLFLQALKKRKAA